MSSPFRIFFSMNTKKFCNWLISYICISVSNFWSHRKSTLLCMIWHCYCFSNVYHEITFWNQNSNFFITSFTLCSRTFSSLSINNEWRSSANKTVHPLHLKEGHLYIYIYIKNRRGPRTEPCGTPHFSTLHEEIYLKFMWLLWFISTNCFQSLK